MRIIKRATALCTNWLLTATSADLKPRPTIRSYFNELRCQPPKGTALQHTLRRSQDSQNAPGVSPNSDSICLYRWRHVSGVSRRNAWRRSAVDRFWPHAHAPKLRERLGETP